MGNCVDVHMRKDMVPQELLHLFRYRLGRGFVSPEDIVLDLGCGSGYGTAMLAEVALRVVGIEAIEAQVLESVTRYQGDNIEFICGNLEAIELPECDVACAFEVIEHLYKPIDFIDKLKKAVTKFIIVSVPIGQKLIWNKDANEFQEEHDWSHHSVFKDGEYVESLFIDAKWRKFFSLTFGVNYIGIFYNNDAI
jgi:protein-L-isoaspartate O-methyltransferase